MVRYLWDGRVQQQGHQSVRGRPRRSRPGRDPHRRIGAHAEPARRARRIRRRLSSSSAWSSRSADSTLRDEARAGGVRPADHPRRSRGGSGSRGRVAAAGARLRVESAGRARGRAQRPHRRARRAVDRGGGLLAAPSAARSRRRSRSCWRSRPSCCRSCCVPLLVGRVRIRDAAIGVALLGALYFPFHDPAALALGAVPNVVAYIRFNGPVFRGLGRSCLGPQGAAAVALLAGLTRRRRGARWRCDASDPAAWAWPMAIALACAPVIYPWYLLYLTPFLWTPRDAAAPRVVPSAAWPPTSSGKCPATAAAGSSRPPSRRSSSPFAGARARPRRSGAGVVVPHCSRVQRRTDRLEKLNAEPRSMSAVIRARFLR